MVNMSSPSHSHDLSMSRKEYQGTYQQYQSERTRVANDPWRLGYHIMPETGWLNDPNGLCQFHGVYHVYYQYSPFDAEGKTKLWGHMTTKDFVNYQQAEPILFPDSRADERGVYSGSAFLHDDQLYFFYTGNVKRFDRDDYDYDHHGREQNTVLVTSRDGYEVSEKQWLLGNDDYPEDMSCHIRDPKILQQQDHYYMVLGARDAKDTGCVLVYESLDLTTWKYHMRITTPKKFGYMWECPDLFEIEGQLFLITCPQGVPSQGYDYANVYQCGYFPIEIDFSKKTYVLGNFHELDRGFDFYAPQSFEDEQGRRILIGWMGMPDIPYTNPTVQRGWQHALSIPRVLQRKGEVLYQEPIAELQALRKEGVEAEAMTFFQQDYKDASYELKIEVASRNSFVIQLKQGVMVSYDAIKGVLTLSFDDSGYGRDSRSVMIEQLQELHVFVDHSSVELFINQGIEVMTTRVYPSDIMAGVQFIQGKIEGTVVYYPLKACSVRY